MARRVYAATSTFTPRCPAGDNGRVQTPRYRLALLAALLGMAAITVIAYYPGMSAGFYFDDETNLLEVAALQWNEFSVSNVSAALEQFIRVAPPYLDEQKQWAIRHLER